MFIHVGTAIRIVVGVNYACEKDNSEFIIRSAEIKIIYKFGVVGYYFIRFLIFINEGRKKKSVFTFKIYILLHVQATRYGIDKMYLLYIFPPELHTLMTSLF
jgi:hypothetical protein